MPKLLNISGTGRSGTTIIKEILSQHPSVATVKGREMRILCDPDGILDFYRTLKTNPSPFIFDSSMKRFESAYKAIMNGSKVHAGIGYHLRTKVGSVFNRVATPRYMGVTGGRFLLNHKQIYNEFLEDLGACLYNGRYIGSPLFEKQQMSYKTTGTSATKQAFRKLVQKYIDGIRAEKPVLCEDNPFSFYFHKEYQELLGTSHEMFFIIRDPRDIVASSIDMTWAPTEVGSCALYIKSILESFEDTPDVKIVKLEEFIANPRQQVKRIFDSIELEDCELDFSMLNNKSIGRYRSLEPSKIRELDRIFHHELEKYGYT